MAQTIRKRKTNRHEHVTQVLLSGKPVTPDEIREVFKGTDQEKVMYRLVTNIYNIRLDGGIIKVHKTGRKVTAYQLLNVKDFDAQGRFIQKDESGATEVESEVQEDVDTEVENTTQDQVESEVA